MPPRNDQPDLAQLADTYEVLGELGGRDGELLTLATRKSDNRPVLIIAQREPAGDEGNALSHLASDARLLMGDTHPAVVPVLDSRWLPNDVLAIVTDRVAAPSLAERLSRREEAFPFPRIAMVLREVNSVIEWARERGVVNRAVRPDSVFLDEGSDQVRVRFTARALALNGIPDAQDDARTIASIARAMLTRSVADPERDAQPLAELRPGLPSILVQQTEAMLGHAESLEPVDVRAYIAGIAMAEELKRGEDECSRITGEMTEEQRITREELAAERKAHEEDLAAQAAAFEKEKQAMLRDMAREREEAARAVAKERAESEKALRQERERLEREIRQERERFEKQARQERDRFEKEMQKQRTAMAREQSRLERDRASLEKERQALARQRELSVPVPLTVEPFDQVVDEPSDVPVHDAGAADDRADIGAPFGSDDTRADDVEVALPPDAPVDSDETDAVREPASLALGPIPSLRDDFGHAGAPRRGAPARLAAPAWLGRLLRDPRLRVGGVAALILLMVVAAAAVATARRDGATRMSQTEPLVSPVSAPLTVADSFAGTIVPSADVDSLVEREAEPSPARRARAAENRTPPAPVEPRPDTIPVVPDPFSPPVLQPAPVPQPPPVPVDSARRDTAVRRDSVARPDSSIRPRTDTQAALSDSARRPGSGPFP